MSFNGSGTFVINTAGQPVVSGTVISSTAFNALTADLATGLSTCITKDGQTTPTANIPMGNNKITGLAVGTAATDAANLSQVQSTTAKLINSVAGADTVTGTMSPTLTAYAAGQMFYWIAAGANTGAVTLNIDSLGAKAVTRDGSTALAAGDIRSGEVVVVVYDGTRFQVVSQVNSGGDATFANVSITSALNVGGVSTFTGLITANGGVSGALNGTVGATTPNTGSFTTLTTSSTVTLNAGTANGVLYLNGSKVATSGSALTFDGTNTFTVATSVPTIAINGTAASGTGARGIDFQYNGTSYGDIRLNVNSGELEIVSGQTGQSGYFQTFKINGSEQMRLTSTGLGIGTSNPVNKLVVSNAGAQGFEFDPANGILQIYNRSTSAYGEFRPYGSLMRFFTGSSPVETMRLDSSGNLGLGVTPSAWSGDKAFQLTGNSVLAGGTNVGTIIGQNMYFDGSVYKYIASAAANMLQFSSGGYLFRQAASGTAGNTITFTTAMTLNADGELLIGTTSDAGAFKLQVNGDALVVGGNALCLRGASSYISSPATDVINFATASTERARITSGGDLLVGTTQVSTNNLNGTAVRLFSGGSYLEIAHNNTATTGQDYESYRYNGTQIGGVSQNGTTGVLFNTTSDRRLKDNITPAPSASDVIDAIEIVSHDWKAAPDEHVTYGVIAQDLHAVAPQAVLQGDDGDEIEKAWGVDYSKLVPMLIKEVQSLRKRVAELEAK